MSSPIDSSQWMYASGGFYNNVVNQSLRFNDGDAAYLSKTYGSAGNRKTWTLSFWVKFSTIQAQTLFATRTDTNPYGEIRFESDGGFFFFGYTGSAYQYRFDTTQLFRDVSAWYHFVFAMDTTQSTESNRTKIYVNGSQITAFDNETYPSLNLDTNVNSDVEHDFGYDVNGTTQAFDGYLAEVNFIDGTALTPASFGETKSGIWIPKDTSGLTFGTNGFRLQFKQTGTSQNASGIGADTSGATTHFAVTDLVASDSNMPDCPENNFATLNPLDNYNTGATFSEGNLKWTIGGADGASRSTYVMTAGKWYMEFLNNNDYIGVVSGNADITTMNGTQTIYYAQDGTKRVNGTSSSYGASFADGDIIGIALDLDAGTQTVNFYKNNAAQGSLNLTDVGNEGYSVSCGSGSGSTNATANFGQDGSFAGAKTAQGNADGNGVGDFFYAPPSGYIALCSANLPDPAIDPAEDDTPADYFNTVLYTGNAGTQSITGVGFSPDWLWVKNRGTTYSHALVDSVRGATLSVSSDSTAAQRTSDITSLDSDGFSLQFVTATGSYSENQGSQAYVAWNWLAGTAFSNDASATSVGTIDSTGQINAKAGFSIIKYTGTRTGDAGETGTPTTIAHGLGKKPTMVLTKRLDAANRWNVWHQGDQPDTTYLNYQLQLDSDGASNNAGWQRTDTGFSTTVFCPARHSYDDVNAAEYIAYVFADVAGYSKAGSFIGNGNADGPFIFTGFRPAWVMFKQSSAAGGWNILDNKRQTFNDATGLPRLYANTTAAEEDGNTMEGQADFLSNGFKLRSNHSSGNTNTKTIIYLAFAEQPFKYANAR